MTIIRNATADQLSEIMDFDHVIRVNGDGTLDTDPQSGLYAPTFDMVKGTGTDEWIEDTSQLGDWTLLSGFTGQYSYTGPVMHQSEFIGGGLARYILDTPGLYVAITVEASCDYDGSTDCDPERGCDCEPAGWAIATIPG